MDNMPSEDERGLESSVIEEQNKIAKRLGKSACEGGLIDPTNINKGYCEKEGGFCNKARNCQARGKYRQEKGIGYK